MNILSYSRDLTYATGRIVRLLAWRMLMRWAGVAPLAIDKTNIKLAAFADRGA